MTEQDEIILEKREMEQRRRLDEKFKQWCKRSEEVSGIEFDIPYYELGFTGCHAKSSVSIFPTQSSLVAISEPPFLTHPVIEIEVVHFERVSLAVKNFDFVIVNKDFVSFKRISSVPMENLDTIKDWLDSNDIVFTEGPISLNWTALLI